jgi:hypothetical protein
MEKDKIEFGVGQLAQETPKPVKAMYRVVMFVCGLWAMCIEPRFPGLPVQLVHVIDNWLLAINGLVYFICQFFGWRVKDNG